MISAMSVKCIPFYRFGCACASFVDAFFGAAPGTATCSGGGEPDLSPFPDQVAFKFYESAEAGEDQFAAGGGGLDGPSARSCGSGGSD